MVDAFLLSFWSCALILPAKSNSTPNITVSTMDQFQAINDSRASAEMAEQANTSGTSQTTRYVVNATDTVEHKADRLKQLLMKNDSVPNDQSKKLALIRVVCSFNSSSPHREKPYTFLIQNMSASLCTDLYYEHAVINDQTFGIQAVSELDIFPFDGNLYIPSYVAINDFKMTHSRLRTFLTITESSNISFSDLADGSSKLKSFVQSCVRQTRIWGFDGINIKWRRPPRLSSLVRIVQHLRTSFSEEKTLMNLPKLLLGVTLFGDITIYDDFEEVATLNKLVDQVTLLAFNDVEDGAGRTQLVSPLYGKKVKTSTEDAGSAKKPSTTQHTEDTNGIHHQNDNIALRFNSSSDSKAATSQIADTTAENKIMDKGQTDDWTYINNLVSGLSQVYSSVSSGTTERSVPKMSKRATASSAEVNLHDSLNALVTHGVDKSKINAGITLIGHSYSLASEDHHGINASTLGPEELYHKSGQVYFSDMCKIDSGVKMTTSPEDSTPYWYRGQVWVSYEDVKSIQQKVNYLLDNHIGGVMVLSQSEDDSTGRSCGGEPFLVSRMVYDMSNVAQGLGHYSYSFPWVEYCGSGTVSGDSRHLFYQCLTLFFLTSVIYYSKLVL
ncbi:acidic mammalian chitinase [Biomphalaria glabrata]|nr:acidic mammalian chitinase [Biomphalaria glabrata]